MVVDSEVGVGDNENGKEGAVQEICDKGRGGGEEGCELGEFRDGGEEGNEVVNV